MTEFSGTESGESSVPMGPPPGAPLYSYPAGAYPPPGFPPTPAGPSNGLAVASLLIGIVGLVTSPILIGLVLGIAAVAMGVVARRRIKRGETAHGGGLALVGVVLGVLATGIGLAVSAIIAFGFATDQFNSTYQHCLGEHNGMSQYCEQYR
jgi:Domain of unknown function (DUF4190)